MFLDCSPNVLGVSTIKTCPRCHEVKHIDEFPRDKTRKAGVFPYCKSCTCERTKEWTQRSPERKKNSDRAYRDAHKDDIAARRAIRYAANIEKEREKSRKWHTANKDYVKAYSKAYRERNREKLKAYREANKARQAAANKAWRDANREYLQSKRAKQRQEYALRLKMWRSDNPERGRAQYVRRRARKHGLPDLFLGVDWQVALDHFGNACAVCGRPIGL